MKKIKNIPSAISTLLYLSTFLIRYKNGSLIEIIANIFAVLGLALIFIASNVKSTK